MKKKIIIITLIVVLLGFIYFNKNIYYELKGGILSIYNIFSIRDNNTNYIDVNKSLKEENVLLKEQLKLNKTLNNYDIENATVLSRNKLYWLSILTIDKGKNNGINKDMLVVTSNGLIGVVEKVYRNSSDIKLISGIDNDIKISVMINVESKDYYGVLSGYDTNKKLLIIKEIDKDSNVKIGDAVTTSGIGVFYPKGINIGKVEEIVYDKYNLSKILYVNSKQDFNTIHYVGVIKGDK